jgi:hypothetical protein
MHGLDPGNNEVEGAQGGDKSLDAQQDAKDYEIEDLQSVLACAYLEPTACTDHTTYCSTVTQGHGTNTQCYAGDSELEQISQELEEWHLEQSRSSFRLGSFVSSNGSIMHQVWHHQ